MKESTKMLAVAVALGLVFIVWGVGDVASGSSIAGTFLSIPKEYTSKEIGIIFYLIAGAKVAAGVAIIYQSFR